MNLSEPLFPHIHAAGGITAHSWARDPKRLAFVLARYKFVARMLEKTALVLEVGCGDGFGSHIVRQHVGALDAIDVDQLSIETARLDKASKWPINFVWHDFMQEPLPGYNAVYALDVFEHIAEEDRFLSHMRQSANVCIIGTPSLESQQFACEESRIGHVNCKSGPELKEAMLKHWPNVFMFSMNDEVVHTGFQPMAHYLLAMGVA